MRAPLVILIAWIVGGLGPAFADPAYLPPFLDRAPAVGDRWVYAAESPFPWMTGLFIVEVVEADEAPGGWRYVVEHHLEPLLSPVGTGLPSRVRTEWFLRLDGSLARGDGWVDGALSIDLRKPLEVIRYIPDPLERTRFGYLGGPRPGKRRGWMLGLYTGRFDPVTLLPGRGSYAVEIHHPPPGAVSVRYEDGGGKRPRPRLSVHYDDLLGRSSWSWIDQGSSFYRWRLVSAQIDGETYEP